MTKNNLEIHFKNRCSELVKWLSENKQSKRREITLRTLALNLKICKYVLGIDIADIVPGCRAMAMENGIAY